MNIHWIQGWLSAAQHYQRFPLKQTDEGAIAAFMDKFCQEQPLADIYEGAYELVDSLKK
jgi:hypothetical protein